jgi:hypothetical protein
MWVWEEESEEEKMNPLIPINAIQMRYISPIYEPIFDEEDNQVDEECVRDGTDVLYECIVPTHNDKLPRYYRLRYRENAKDHKRRWEHWLEDNLINGSIPYFVKVKKIGRRVLFEYDPTLMEKREKKLRAMQHKKEMQARKLARQVAAKGAGPLEEESWNEWFKRLESDVCERGVRAYEEREEWRRGIESIPSAFEEDDEEVLIEDEYIGETQQGEAVYEDRESGDLYEER